MSTPSNDLAASAPPRVEERPEQLLVALHAESAFERFTEAVDSGFPELFGWLAAHGVEPAGPPLIHYELFEPERRFVVEIAAPVGAGATAGDERVRPLTLPGGRYLVYEHRGAYRATTATWAGRDLAAAHALVQEWAAREGLRFAGEQTPDGFRYTARVERYLAGPPQLDDPADWRTELAFLLAD